MNKNVLGKFYSSGTWISLYLFGEIDTHILGLLLVHLYPWHRDTHEKSNVILHNNILEVKVLIRKYPVSPHGCN